MKVDRDLLKALLIRLKENKNEADLHKLSDLVTPRLFAEAKKFFNDPEEAESTVNLVLAKLWYRAEFYNTDRPPLPYVISILRNYCRDCIRKKSRSINTLNVELPVRSDHSDYYDYLGVLREVLPSELYNIVELSLTNNLKDIAKLLNLSVTEVKSKVEEARRLASSHLLS